ncbi:MAG: PAS domain S-box protein [Rhodoplanes sp.]|uniref:PAS domain S-box protein n=1 Tax=Rhodoplanes sp. TaxID=1968906 RepID=UPI00179FE67C|nr:PAS domain S-box protein [Rhodoplanes sp.]NVO13951.1 PAS domain S-box protein [Rhodoplanes sp.]
MGAVPVTGAPHERDELLRLCIEAAPVGIAMFDRQMRYLAASRRYQQDHGVADQRLVGRSHYEVFPDIPQRWRDMHGRCLAGASERCDADYFEAPDGTRSWFRWEVRPWLDPAGGVGGIVLFTENITAHVARETELRRWADAFENAAFGIAVSDASTNTIDFVNPARAAMCGLTIEEVCGSDVLASYPQDERPRIKALIDEADRAGRVIYESMFVRKDGSNVPVELDITSVRNADGSVRYRIATALDITDRQRSERARKDSEAEARRYSDLLRTIIDTMAEAVLMVDADGRTLFANAACKAMFDNRDDIGSEAWQKIFHRFRPDGVTPYPVEETPIGRALQGQNFDNLYVICKRDDGPPDLHIVASGRSIRNEAGQHEAAVVVYRDVSELTEKTLAAQRSAELLDKTIASIPDAFLVVDERRNFLHVNPACKTLLGIDGSVPLDEWEKSYAVLGADGTTEVPSEERPLNRVLSGEPIDGTELVLRDLESRRDLVLSLTARPIYDGDGIIRGAVLLYHDLTKSKHIERQLRQGQKMDAIGQLTGGVAHDFNNILTAITCTIEILAKGVADQPHLATIARIIDQAARRGADLTRQLLAFARRQPLEPRPTDINGLMTDTARLLRPTLGEHIELAAVLADGLWPAMVDASQLSTAVINLAVNARDAMPDGGKLVIETANVTVDGAYVESNPDARPGDYVMIAVSDNGTGIPAEVRDKVFEPFFTTKEVGRGTGLGLSMVYGFIRQSGGHVKLYSEEGQGTSIKLYLPRIAEAEDGVDEMPAVDVMAGGDETILVVEDDDLVRRNVIALLQDLGYRTWSASSGPEALGLLDQGAEFDLLFTDIIMPGGMNGRELAAEVLRRRPGAKVLYTSGYAEDAIVHHGRLDPGVTLLNKPYRKADVVAKVREALAGPVATGTGPRSRRRRRTAESSRDRS